MTKHKLHEAKNALNFIAQLYSERGQGRVGGEGEGKEGVSDGDGKNEKRSKVRGKSLQQHR